MHRARLAACLLAAFTTSQTFAKGEADGAWRGSLAFGLSLAQGNSDSSSVNLGVDAARATPKDKITLKATALRSEATTNGVSTTTAELATGNARYDRNLGERWLAYGSLGLERDGLQRLDLRSSLGAGVGYHVIQGRETSFDVFGGLAATREDYETRGRTFTEASFGEESSHKLTPTTTFKQRLAVYPNLDESGEWRAELDASLAAAINSRWSLKVSVTSRYKSDPLPGLESTDTFLLIGLSGKFGPD